MKTLKDFALNYDGPVWVSACLAGRPCRYDGQGKNQSFSSDLNELVKQGKVILGCPEESGGLPTPRPAAEIQNGNGQDVLTGQCRIKTNQGKDVTAAFISGGKKELDIAIKTNCTAAIFKTKSPSCGIKNIYDGSFQAILKPGKGVTAELFFQHGIKLYNEHDFE